MQPITVVVLACLVAVVVASAQSGPSPAEEQLYESVYDSPEYERSSRTKRGLLLLKKKLLLGALGLKVAKVGAVGAGVAGVVALKKGHAHHYSHHNEHSYSEHPHAGHVEVHRHYYYEPSSVEEYGWSG